MRLTAAITGLSVVFGGTALSTVGTVTADAATTPNCATFTQSVYQRVNPKNNVQLITASKNEYDSAGVNGFTQDLAIAFKASTSGTGTTAVYRLTKSAPSDWVWAASSTDIAALVKQGYTKGGGSFLAATTPSSCLQPVYTMIKSGLHRQTSDAITMAALKKAGWATQGVAFYAAAAKTATPATPTSTPTSAAPTVAPSSAAPTVAPTSAAPTVAPTSAAPTVAPSSAAPTVAPTSAAPTAAPTSAAPSAPAVLGGVPTGPTDLDPSGNTVPDSNYAIPAGATFISPSGNDANAGTQAAPVRTLNRAIDMTPANGTVVFRAGVYRDSYSKKAGEFTLAAKGLTLQAYPHEQVWLDGSDLVSGDKWTADSNGHWYTTWDTPDFCGFTYYQADPNSTNSTCTYKDMIHGSALNPLPADPQQVFANGVRQHQTDALSKVNGSNFYYDWSAHRMYIGVNPNTTKVELTKRAIALVLAGNSRNTVRGIGIRRYGSSAHEGIGGAVYVGGFATFENTAFVDNSQNALAFSLKTQPSRVSHSVFSGNGYTGIGANGTSERTNVPDDDFVVENSVFDHNNWEDNGLQCTVSCGQASVKLAHMRGYTFRGNLVRSTGGNAAGLWCDLNCSQGAFVGNVVTDQPTSTGIFVEVSNTTIVAGNLVARNKWGITIASANTKVYNNTLVDNLQSIRVYDDWRSKGQVTDGKVWTDVGPDTSNVEVGNNVSYSANYSLVAFPMRAGQSAPNTGSESFFSYVDHNAFFQDKAGTPMFVSLKTLAGKETVYRKQSEMAGTGFEANSLWVAGTDPFVNRAAGDYRMKADVADRVGLATARGSVPADVAAQLGISAQASVPMGAAVLSSTN